MKNIKHLIYVSLWFLPAVLYSQTMSFEEALNIMHKENLSVEIEQKKNESHEYELNIAKANRYPKIYAFGQYLHLNEEIGKDLNGARNKVAGLLHLPSPLLLGNWDITILKKDIGLAGVGAMVPIFAGGKINTGIKAAQIKHEIGEKELKSTKNKLVSELADRYYQTKLVEEALKVRLQVLEGMKTHLYNAQKLEEQGIIAPVEKLQAEVAVANAKREYQAAQKDIALARSALANTLEKEGITQDLTSDFFIAEPLQDLEYYQQQAIENYPEIQKLNLQLNLADAGVKAKKADHLPTVFGFGTKVLISNNPLIDNNNPWMVGVGASYTIFDGLKRKNEIKEAQITKETVELYKQKAGKDIKLLVQKYYQELQKEEEQIKSLEVQVNALEELKRVRTKGFIEGVSTSTDVVDAEINLAAIKLMKLQAYYKYEISLANLLEYSGLSQKYVEYIQ